ncbi:MAG: IclR family transcriptional regulator [Desulfobacula sp.]|jgi:DNA-binding IclR family transcriptional regulator|nr:IclR family transcriptional regulator [Desulfobacula sp.]
MEQNSNYRIKVLEKTFKLLGLFSEERPALSIKEINDLLDFNKSSTFRIIKNLEEVAYLTKDPITLKYKLGYGIYYMGNFAESHTVVHKIAKPYLQKLNEECVETIHLAVMCRGQALYLEKIEGKRVLTVISKTGTKLPCHCSGVGKILLSDLPEAELAEIIREWGLPEYTCNTITDMASLKKELIQIRKQGYAIDNEEIENSLKCIAAPIRDSRQRVIAAISISAPKERFDHDEPNFRFIVKKTAQEISDRLTRHEEGNMI